MKRPIRRTKTTKTGKIKGRPAKKTHDPIGLDGSFYVPDTPPQKSRGRPQQKTLTSILEIIQAICGHDQPGFAKHQAALAVGPDANEEELAKRERTLKRKLRHTRSEIKRRAAERSTRRRTFDEKHNVASDLEK